MSAFRAVSVLVLEALVLLLLVASSLVLGGPSYRLGNPIMSQL